MLIGVLNVWSRFSAVRLRAYVFRAFRVHRTYLLTGLVVDTPERSCMERSPECVTATGDLPWTLHREFNRFATTPSAFYPTSSLRTRGAVLLVRRCHHLNRTRPLPPLKV